MMSLLIVEVFPARTLGVIAYGTASLACAVRWWLGRSGRTGRPFSLLAGIQIALLLDMIFDLRWKLHAVLDRVAMMHGVYGMRRAPQLVVLVVMMVVLSVEAVLIMRKYRRRPGAMVAVAGTLAAVMMWSIEVISYHWLDAALYSAVGPFMAVSLVWVLLALVTCAGVWIDLRARESR